MATGIGHYTVLGDDECRELLRTHQVARVGWESTRGPQILPITYVLRGGDLYFRTRPDALLAELRTGVRVAVELDALDPETRTGWSVLATGTTSSPEEPDELVELWTGDVPQPWVDDDRLLFIRVALDAVSGRVLAADD